jgi:hypothetical protein
MTSRERAHLIRFALISVALAAAPLVAAATEQAGQRRDARDTKQDARQESRVEKVDCKQANQKNNSECRQDKRDTKQEGRKDARDIKY